MVVNTSGTFSLVIMGLSTHVFGSVSWTCTFLVLLFVLFAMLVRVPVAFSFALGIPMAVVFAAFGYMTVLFAGLLSVVFMVLAIGSFMLGLGNR